MVLVTVGVALSLLQGDSIQLRSAAFNWSVVLLSLFILQSMLVAYDISKCLYEVLKVVKSLVMVYLIVQLIRTPRDLHQYALVIYFGALASVVLGILNYKMGWVQSESVVPGATGMVRFTGTQGNPNELAAYLASVLPIGIYAARKFRRWYSRTFMVLGTVLILLMIFTTFSRAAMFPIAFIILAILVRDVRNKWAFLFILAAAGTGLALIPASYWNRLSTLSDLASSQAQSADWSLYLRLKLTKIAWNFFLAYPFTGIGIGNLVVRSGPYVVSRVDVHNSFLQVLAGVGIFGFIAYVAMYVTVIANFMTAIRERWSKQDEWMKNLSFYMMVAFASTLISISFEYLSWLPAAGGLAAGRIALRYRAARSADASAPEHGT